MRNIVVSEFITLDGVMEAPDQWSFPFWNDEIARFKSDELFAAGALLLGRVTYQGFAAAWPGRKSVDAYSERINTLPKYVVSTSLEEAAWENSQVIRSHVIDEIARLRQQPGQDLLVFGSRLLVLTLLQHGLVDRYNLLVYPVLRGAGKRLFADGGAQSMLTLLETRSFDSGVTALVYQTNRSA